MTDNAPPPFILGVNYWPRRNAMFMWRDFDAEQIREEFEIIASLGMSLVRVFLLWEDWQPTPDAVDETALANLGTVLDIAEENGLGLDITFFTGHMSGPNWSPPWLLSNTSPYPSKSVVRQVVTGGVPVQSSYRNMFHDETALAAEKLLLTTVVTRYKDHPGVYMWNLGNEPDLFAWANNHTAGGAWVTDMIRLIKDIDPDHIVTCGLHVESLIKDCTLRVNEVFAEADLCVMHGYPMYADWSADPLDPHFVPFIGQLTSALAGGKPVLMEEWGGPTAPPGEPSQTWSWTGYGRQFNQFMASEEDFATYVDAVHQNLLATGAVGSLLWCYADYTQDLWDKPPCKESRHERHFGLVRADGSLKPHAEAVRAFAATNPTVQPASRAVTLDVTPDEYYQAPLATIKRLYGIYRDAYA